MCHLLPARVVGLLGHFLESEPVKYAAELSPGQAFVTRYQIHFVLICILQLTGICKCAYTVLLKVGC